MSQPVIVIDLRCLQEPRYAERGIPGHARNVITKAREVSAYARNARIIGIVDPALHEVEAPVAAIMDELRPNAYLPRLPPGSVFLNPSSMTHDQTFIARLLLNPEIHKALIVHDFIPYEDPEYYMKFPAVRLDFRTSYVWLNRYNVFLPISEHIRNRLHEIYALGNRPSFVTGVHVAEWLERSPSALPEPKHILAVTGDHPRKNAEILIKAHAASALLQTRRIPLVIGGYCPPAQAENFRNLARQSGGDPALLNIPGIVPNEILLNLYRGAVCVVTPSRNEGFSMPVVEAMAAGVPSIASDIPAHAALIKDKSLRFNPGDDAALKALLERIILEPDFRDSIIAGQSDIWPQFKAEKVAKTLWSAIEASLETTPRRSFSIGGRRPRLAMLTPLPPTRSGVADFSAVCGKSLAQLVELEFFSTVTGAAAKPLSAIPHLSNKFNRVISVLGNSEYHGHIFDLLSRYGGACICHDAKQLNFYIWKFGWSKAAEMAAKELARDVTEDELRQWQDDQTRGEALGFGDLAKSASPIIFHSRKAVLNFQNRYGVKAHYLPFAIYRSAAAPRTENVKQMQRDRLGIAASEYLIISLGFVDAVKGVAAAIEAMVFLAEMGVNAKLIWVGKIFRDQSPFAAKAKVLGVADRIAFLDRYVDEENYRAYLQAADCGLQLRVGGSGNISGALQDCIAAGLPSVANDDLAESLNAPSYVTRVDDALNPREIAIALAAHRDSPPDTSAERESYTAAHSMDVYARRLCDILELDLKLQNASLI